MTKKPSKGSCEAKGQYTSYKSITNPPKYMAIAMTDGSSPPHTIEFEGDEYAQTDHIPIDVNLIPDYVRDVLSAALLASVRKILKEPGGHEMLEARINMRKKRGCQ